MTTACEFLRFEENAVLVTFVSGTFIRIALILAFFLDIFQFLAFRRLSGMATCRSSKD